MTILPLNYVLQTRQACNIAASIS